MLINYKNYILNSIKLVNFILFTVQDYILHKCHKYTYSLLKLCLKSNCIFNKYLYVHFDHDYVEVTPFLATNRFKTGCFLI